MVGVVGHRCLRLVFDIPPAEINLNALSHSVYVAWTGGTRFGLDFTRTSLPIPIGSSLLPDFSMFRCVVVVVVWFLCLFFACPCAIFVIHVFCDQGRHLHITTTHLPH